MMLKRDSGWMPHVLAAVGCLMMMNAGPARAVVIHVPADYPTIQEAIDAAADDDEIIVAPGTYYERINFLGKAIWLHSAIGPDATIIDGSGLYDTVVTCMSGEGPDTILEGFTITGGDSYWGGGMRIDGSSPAVLDCTFTGNMAVYGAAMHTHLSDALVSDCTFIENAASHGAGMYNRYSRPIVQECVFRENVAFTSGGGMGGTGEDAPDVSNCAFIDNMAEFGGGLQAQFMAVNVTDCVFEGNRAWYNGGGMILRERESQIVRCIFRGNIAYADGGGLYNDYYSGATISDCLFEANWAYGDGGGSYDFHADPTVVDCTFTENRADHGGGIAASWSSSSIVLRCTFSGNSARDGGGGIRSFDSPFTVLGCVFHANMGGGLGGGMRNDDGCPIVTQCLFADNSAGGGGGIGNLEGSPHVIGCTFHGNTGCLGGGIYTLGGHFLASGCILWENEGAEIYGSPETTSVTYSAIEGYYPGEGNIYVDPLFVDAANDDYHLMAGSPCIDAADNTAVPADVLDLDDDGDTEEPIPYDLDGKPRFVDDPDTEDTGNGEPPIIDMGAYEYQVESCPGDFDGDGDVDTADLLFLFGAWGTPNGDVDFDGDTDTADLLALLAAWGDCPE